MSDDAEVPRTPKLKPAKKPERVATRVRQATEDEKLLASYDPSQFDRPSVTVDVAILSVIEDKLVTLLHRRENAPFRGRFALPGGFLQMDESLESAARRVLLAKAGLRDVYLEQLYTFGAVHRDPRMRILTVAYFALVDASRLTVRHEASLPERALAEIVVPWAGETGGPIEIQVESARTPESLAFDHADILGTAVKRLRGKLDYTPIGFQLLPEVFTLASLQRVHETILGRPLNKDSFRRRMLASGQLEATGELQSGVDHRPAELYRFTRLSAV